jgi:hypothetical protein
MHRQDYFLFNFLDEMLHFHFTGNPRVSSRFLHQLCALTQVLFLYVWDYPTSCRIAPCVLDNLASSYKDSRPSWTPNESSSLAYLTYWSPDLLSGTSNTKLKWYLSLSTLWNWMGPLVAETSSSALSTFGLRKRFVWTCDACAYSFVRARISY